MTDTIEVHIGHGGQTHLVGWCRRVSGRHGRGSLFDYADEWLERPDAMALDPANLPLEARRVYTRSEKSALPGVLRDTAPDRLGGSNWSSAPCASPVCRGPCRKSTICWRSAT